MPLNDHTSPREQLRYDLRERFREAMRGLVERVDTELLVTDELGPDNKGKHLWSGVPVLTMPSLNEALRTFDEPLPAPSEVTAELRTPGTLFVAAECPECHLPQQIPMVIDVKLEVEGSIRTLHLKGKSKAAVHRCGQLPLPERKPEDQGELPWNETEEEPAEADSRCANAACVLEADHAGDCVAGDTALDGTVIDPVDTPELEPCPSPDCILPAEHTGDHQIPWSKQPCSFCSDARLNGHEGVCEDGVDRVADLLPF
jgi:hypothetical protein